MSDIFGFGQELRSFSELIPTLGVETLLFLLNNLHPEGSEISCIISFITVSLFSNSWNYWRTPWLRTVSMEWSSRMANLWLLPIIEQNLAIVEVSTVWINFGRLRPLEWLICSIQTEFSRASVLNPKVAYNSSQAPKSRRIRLWFQRIFALIRILTWSRNFRWGLTNSLRSV